MSLSLVLERDSFAPGDRVSGVVTVIDSGLQLIQVGLLFREESIGLEATARQVLAEGFDDALEFEAGVTLPFELEVPPDAPPTLSTSHGGLFWEVVAKTDRVGEPQAVGRRVVVGVR